MTDTAEILLKAADVIEIRGWHQGGYMPSFSDVDTATCPVCVLAALNVAAGAVPDEGFDAASDRQDAAFALADFLGLGGEVDSHEVDGIETVIGNEWNDETATSAEQVTTALRECADDLDRRAA